MSTPLFLFSLWYYPSHFGVHVDDMADGFAAAGYDVSIVTVKEEVFSHRYFDGVRHMFVKAAVGERRVVRLSVSALTERGPCSPIVELIKDENFDAVAREVKSGSAHLVHFFEMLVGEFSRAQFPNALDVSVIYAGNFVSRLLNLPCSELSTLQIDAAISEMLEPHLETLEQTATRLRGVDVILSETQSLASMMVASRLRTAVEYVSRPIAFDQILHARRRDVRMELGFSKNARVLIYAGRPTKNAEILPRVLRRVQEMVPAENVVLALIGTQNVDVRSWPDFEAQSRRIRTVPFATRDTLYGYLKSADVLVYPSLLDGQAKIISESQAAGLPAVVFDAPASANGEIVDGLTTGLIVPCGDLDAFTRAVRQLLADEPFRTSLAQSSRLFAAQTMTPAAFVARVELIWSAMANAQKHEG